MGNKIVVGLCIFMAIFSLTLVMASLIAAPQSSLPTVLGVEDGGR